jgi:hypothetical protein
MQHIIVNPVSGKKRSVKNLRVVETLLQEAPLTMETEAIDGLVDVETGEVLEHQSQVLPDVPQPESEPTDAEPADAELADAAEGEMKDDF